jgi:hypothetical protein
LEFDEALQRGFIELTAAEGRDNRSISPGEHNFNAAGKVAENGGLASLFREK